MNYYPKHYCGVFGVFGHPNAAELTFYGLQALQHRGQESAGIVSSLGDDTSPFRIHRGMGLVRDTFTADRLAYLGGRHAVGHTRYSTTGSSTIENTQPFTGTSGAGKQIAIAHNGNLTNTRELRAELPHAVFTSTTDSEIILRLLPEAKGTSIVEALKRTMPRLQGAYSLGILADSLIGARDPFGFRPLSIGRKEGAWILSSETCGFDRIKATFVRDVEPGEIVVMNEEGLTSIQVFPEHATRAFCIFELIYFARPDSKYDKRTVYGIRKKMGEALARECPLDADIVVPIPDSGKTAALGYAYALGIRYEEAFMRDHYAHRTFLKPSQALREAEADAKLNLMRELVEGLRVIIIDDSIVRGTTCRARVNALKEAGATEVHVLVSCPPHMWPCYYGVDFPDRSKLLAVTHSMEQIREYLGADSVNYLSLGGVIQATGLQENSFCTACFTGRYPVLPPEDISLEK